jgi:HNH endonuclease.
VVTVPALALLDQPHAADDNARTVGPAVVEGLGPIPLQRARELCGGAKGWMRVLTHPETGMVLSVGRDQYRPPASLQRLVKWRADRCMAPGCGIPASRCQIDHSLAWEHGGATALTNLGPLCTGHHTVKHHGGWTLRQYDDGTIEWISPSGRHYVVTPERRVPVFRATDDQPAPF